MWCVSVPLDSAPHACRYLVVLPNRLKKVICNFENFAEEHATNLTPLRLLMLLPARPHCSASPTNLFL